jgi:hypothetical protein
MLKIQTPKITLEADSLDDIRQLAEIYATHLKGRERVEREDDEEEIETPEEKELNDLKARYKEVMGIRFRLKDEHVKAGLDRLGALRKWAAGQDGEGKPKFETVG